MSEENRKSGMEINDSALEGVSGGYDNPAEAVGHLCPYCHNGINRGLHHCVGGTDALYQYLREHGPNSVRQEIECPFYRRGKGA